MTRSQSDNTILPARPAGGSQAMIVLAMLLLVGCVYRLIWIQSRQATALQQDAAHQQVKKWNYPAMRGSILDSNPLRPDQHNTLATSYLVDSVYVDPTDIKDPDLVLGRLARLLGISRDDLAEVRKQFDEKCTASDDTPGRRFLWVRRKITVRQAEQVAELLRDDAFHGVGMQKELDREYPCGSLAANVVGFVGKEGEGLEGVEKRFDRTLTGTDGTKSVITDSRRRPIWSDDDYRPPSDGHSIVLYINAVIQAQVEQALAETVSKFEAESGVAVVMDPRNGAILAMANVPSFDPGDYQSSLLDHRRNRCLTDPFEPGSIFKWVVMAGALDRGVVRPDDSFDCHGGSWNWNGRTIRDSHPYGTLTVRQILTKSSNIGMSQIALKLIGRHPTVGEGREALYRIIHDFGFGQQSGIELSGAESPGLLYPANRWTSYSAPSLSFGQEITVTAVQMVRAFSAIANGGRLLRPRLVRQIIDDSEVCNGTPPVVVKDFSERALREAGEWEERRILSRETSRTMIDILTDVVETGTGKAAKIDGVKVFGKTGTAQIGRGGHYLQDQYTSSFIGGAPSENPRLVVLVSIRRPNASKGYYGGTVAAPAVKAIIEQALPFMAGR